MEEEEKEEDVWSTVAANTKGRRVLCTQVSCSMEDCDARGYYAVSPDTYAGRVREDYVGTVKGAEPL